MSMRRLHSTQPGYAPWSTHRPNPLQIRASAQKGRKTEGGEGGPHSSSVIGCTGLTG